MLESSSARCTLLGLSFALIVSCGPEGTSAPAPETSTQAQQKSGSEETEADPKGGITSIGDKVGEIPDTLAEAGITFDKVANTLVIENNSPTAIEVLPIGIKIPSDSKKTIPADALQEHDFFEIPSSDGRFLGTIELAEFRR